MASLILLFIATLTTVNAAIDTSRYEKYYKYRPKATYTDIVKAMFLVDFNLSIDDLNNFKLSPWTDAKKSAEHTPKVNEEYLNALKTFITSDGYNQAIFQMDLFLKTFSDVKSNKEINKPRYSQFYNALYMALNYDFMAQILDPNYKTNFHNIIPTGRLGTDRRLSTFQRWGVDLTGIGTRHIDDIIRGNFVLLSEEDKEEVRRQVYRLYVSLDEYVLKTLNTTFSNSDNHDEKCSNLLTEVTYEEITKAAELIDLNLSESEITWIKEFAWPANATTNSSEVADDWPKELSKIESQFPDRNTSEVFNALYLIINFDAMGQILDPNYEPRMFNFTRAIQEGTKDSAKKMPALQLLHNRWTPDLFGVGFQPPASEKSSPSLRTYLYQYFDKAREKYMDEIRRDVCRMRSRLGNLVLEALKNQNSSK